MNSEQQKNYSSTNSDKNWFFFTLLFIIIDYGRPQDIISIGFLRPAMIVNLILIFYIVTEGHFTRYSSKQIRYILYFIALLAAHIPFARNNFYAWKTTEAMLLYLPFILSVIATVTSLERLKKIVFVLICLVVYITGYCLTHHGVGSGNYFADENDISLYIDMYLPFCYFLMFYEQEIQKKLFYLFVLIMGLAGIVTSFSRGGFVGLLAMGTVAWLVSPKKILSLILIMITCGVFYLSVGNKYFNEMETIRNPEVGTADVRLESWKAGWRMFLDNPLGVGGNNFQVRFPEYQGDFFKRGMWGRVAHSLWFTLISELGVPGILVYFVLLWATIKDLLFLRRLKPGKNPDIQYLRVLSLAMLASFAGYFAAGSFISVLYYPHYWYLLPVIVAMVKIAGSDLGENVAVME